MKCTFYIPLLNVFPAAFNDSNPTLFMHTMHKYIFLKKLTHPNLNFPMVAGHKCLKGHLKKEKKSKGRTIMEKKMERTLM